MSRKKITRETLIQGGAVVLTIGAFIGAVAAIGSMVSTRTANTSETVNTASMPTDSQRHTFTFTGKDYYLKDNVETILVMGIDNYGVDNKINDYLMSSQCDVIYLFVVDHDSKTYQTLQLNRDTMTSVRSFDEKGNDIGYRNLQLALAHSYGKDEDDRCLNAAEAVSGLLFDTPIDHYISLTMEAIPVLNNSVGGVTVTVPGDMTAADPSFVEGATIKLRDDQVEDFVRARMSLPNDTNIFRMERQKQYLDNWKNLAVTKVETDPKFALELVLSLSEYMTSDMSANELSDFGSTLSDYQDLGLLTTTGRTEEDHLFTEYFVDMDDLEAKIVSMLYVEAEG